MCVLGYCLFPLLCGSIVFKYAKEYLFWELKIGILIFIYLWAVFSSISFMGDIVGQDKKMLGVYPNLLFYFSLCCLLFL
jgi:hypothetical protein